MKKALIIFLGILLFGAPEVAGAKKHKARVQKAAVKAEPGPGAGEEKESLRGKKRGELVLYKVGAVECSVSSTKNGFLFRADDPNGYDGRMVHEVEISEEGRVLSNKNYPLHKATGKRIGAERAAIYHIFLNRCMKYRVAIVGKRDFPPAVARIIDGRERELFTASPPL